MFAVQTNHMTLFKVHVTGTDGSTLVILYCDYIICGTTEKSTN